MQKQVTKRQEMLDFAEKQPANEPQPIMSFFYNVSSKQTEGQLKNQIKELDSLQWMIAQEKKLKSEQEKMFQANLKKAEQAEMLIRKAARQASRQKNQSAAEIKLGNSPYKNEPPTRDKPKVTKKSSKQGKKHRPDSSKPKIYPTVPSEFIQPKLVTQSKSKQKVQFESPQKPIVSEFKGESELLEKEVLKEKIKQVDAMLYKIKVPEKAQAQYPFTGHLLARSIQKLVQSHSEYLTELLIEDLLVETVGVLNDVERTNQQKHAQLMHKQTLNDFIEAVKDLAHDQEQIEARQARPKQVTVTEPDAYRAPLSLEGSSFTNVQDRVRYVETSSGFVMKILEARKKRINQTRKTSLYAQKNIEVFNQVCSETMDQLLGDAANHMDRFNDQMAEQIFLNEFK